MGSKHIAIDAGIRYGVKQKIILRKLDSLSIGEKLATGISSVYRDMSIQPILDSMPGQWVNEWASMDAHNLW
eukprot:3473215-Karenia_brevis.AAC.1